MDPSVVYARLATALDTHNYTTAREARDTLYNWLKSGGFPPDWDVYPHARSYYRARYGV